MEANFLLLFFKGNKPFFLLVESNLIVWLHLFKGGSRYKIKVQRVDGSRKLMMVLAKPEIS